MKNIKKLFGIIALVSVIALSFASCTLDPGDDGVEKILIVTDLPTTFQGKQITVAITDPASTKVSIVALDQLVVPNGLTTVTSLLLSGNENKKGGAFTGTGDFYIYLFVDTPGTPSSLDDDDTYFNTGTEGGTLAKKVTISEEKTTVSFKWFKKTS